MINPFRDPVVLSVTESSQVGEARRAAVALALGLGFDEPDQGTVALVVTEAATNLVKHARQGEIILRTLPPDQGRAVEVLAVDRGPGIADVGRCLSDGFSTKGTAGTGLGAIRRLSTSFDLHTVVGKGTVLLARVRSREASPPRLPFEVGGVCLPVAGEEACGDAWAVDHVAGQSRFLVVDGLGHGLPAAQAAHEAVRVFRAYPDRAPAAILETIHGALRSTRGAAAAIAAVDRSARVVRFAGVGNISGIILAPEGRQSMVSHSGTLGHQVRKIHEFTYPWPAGALLILHSDGLASQWSLDSYPGLTGRDPAVMAGVLYRDHRRGRDDATVVVSRQTPEDGTGP